MSVNGVFNKCFVNCGDGSVRGLDLAADSFQSCIEANGCTSDLCGTQMFHKFRSKCTHLPPNPGNVSVNLSEFSASNQSSPTTTNKTKKDKKYKLSRNMLLAISVVGVIVLVLIILFVAQLMV